MRDTTIQRLSADSPHLPTVVRWTFAAWGNLYPGLTLEEAIDDTMSECGISGVPSVFIALQDDVPVGTACLIDDDMSIRRELTPWLASVFVAPEWRGQGVASALVQRVEAEVRNSGIHQCYLYTPDQQSLYQRLGWQAIETLEYRGETVTLMRRLLTESSR
ncbi:MAG: GNAT family N-acetyltransferase [Halomonas sp.]